MKINIEKEKHQRRIGLQTKTKNGTLVKIETRTGKLWVRFDHKGKKFEGCISSRSDNWTGKGVICDIDNIPSKSMFLDIPEEDYRNAQKLLEKEVYQKTQYEIKKEEAKKTGKKVLLESYIEENTLVFVEEWVFPNGKIEETRRN